MTLTRDNYHDLIEIDGKPVVSASILKYAYPGEGGSLAQFEHYVKKRAEQTDEEEKKHQRMGTLLHKWIEDKHQFIVDEGVKPENWICTIIDRALPHIKLVKHEFAQKGIEVPNNLVNFQQQLKDARIGIQSGWGDEAVLKHVVPKGQDYLNFLFTAENKIILSQSDKDCLNGMQTSVENSPYADVLVGKRYPQGEIFSEKIIQWQYNDIHCKSMIDILKYNHKDKLVVIDEIKTTSKPVGTFMYGLEVKLNNHGEPYLEYVPGSAYKYRYYRQHAMYGAAIHTENIHQDYAMKNGYYVISTVEPYEVAYYSQEPNAIVLGALEIDEAMKVIKQYYDKLNRGGF